MESELCCDLWTATIERNLCAIHQLVEEGADVNEIFSEGMTSLHVATMLRHEAIVHYLVEVGSDVNKTGHFGITPLMTACSLGFIELSRFLIQSGANVNAINDNLESSLMYLNKNRSGVVKTKEFLGYVHGCGRICDANDICDCIDVVQLLVASGADVNLVDKKGMTPLIGFILSRHHTVAKFLIQSGADTNLAMKIGTTALLVASQLNNSLELLEMLISAGADVNDARSLEGITPLMAACRRGYDNVEALLRAGALVSATDSKGETALKYAVFGTNPLVIDILAKTGLRIGKELLLAIMIGHGESIQALITNGALPGTFGSMSSMKNDVEYLSRRFSIHPSDFLGHKLLDHLNVLGVTSLTPFMVALMRSNTVVARYFVRNLFFHPLDILLLQDLQKKRSMLEDSGLNSCLSPLVSQPWSLFNLSFLCVSFAVGFCPNREKRILLTGLPASLHRMFLYRDKAAFLLVRDWANLDFFL